jgi:hypothetical protein
MTIEEEKKEIHKAERRVMREIRAQKKSFVDKLNSIPDSEWVTYINETAVRTFAECGINVSLSKKA